MATDGNSGQDQNLAEEGDWSDEDEADATAAFELIAKQDKQAAEEADKNVHTIAKVLGLKNPGILKGNP